MTPVTGDISCLTPFWWGLILKAYSKEILTSGYRFQGNIIQLSIQFPATFPI